MIGGNNIQLVVSFSRHPFKPHPLTNLNDDDDDDDHYFDIVDEDEDEALDCEQTLNDYELEANEQTQNYRSTQLSIDLQSSTPSTSFVETDQYISDDEEDSKDSSVSLSSLTNSESKQMFQLLNETYLLLIRSRKLIKIMRNTTAIDNFVRSSPDGCHNGFVIDMEVSTLSDQLRFEMMFLDDCKNFKR